MVILRWVTYADPLGTVEVWQLLGQSEALFEDWFERAGHDFDDGHEDKSWGGVDETQAKWVEFPGQGMAVFFDRRDYVRSVVLYLQATHTKHRVGFGARSGGSVPVAPFFGRALMWPAANRDGKKRISASDTFDSVQAKLGQPEDSQRWPVKRFFVPAPAPFLKYKDKCISLHLEFGGDHRLALATLELTDAGMSRAQGIVSDARSWLKMLLP